MPEVITIIERTRRQDGAIQVTLPEIQYPDFVNTEDRSFEVRLSGGRILHIQEDPIPYGRLRGIYYRAQLETPQGWGTEFDGPGDRKAAWRRFLKREDFNG